jgi:hypothetical protein
MMDDKLAFDEFIHDWRASRVIALGGIGVPEGDRDRLFERRASELSELAIRHGYRQRLAEAARPYRGIVGYVKALYDSAEHQSKQGPA